MLCTTAQYLANRKTSCSLSATSENRIVWVAAKLIWWWCGAIEMFVSWQEDNDYIFVCFQKSFHSWKATLFPSYRGYILSQYGQWYPQDAGKIAGKLLVLDICKSENCVSLSSPKNLSFFTWYENTQYVHQVFNLQYCI